MHESTGPEERAEELADKTARIKEAVDEAARTAKNKINDFESLKGYFRENPVRAMAVIFGVGFIAGLLCRK